MTGACAELSPTVTGLKRWDKGRWGIGNKHQNSRDPLTHLLSPLILLLRLAVFFGVSVLQGAPNL